MATYKAEFMSHYYDGRIRPRQAYVFGLIDVWSRLAAKMPALANFLTHGPGFSALAKAVVGIPKQRQIPQIAAESFTLTFAPAAAHKGDRPQVILWPDTFNNYYHPYTFAAAAEVLDAAGFCVRMPQRPLCCGRPLYEFGMLGLAKRRISRILEALRNEIRAGVPVVVLEPACASVFRDELLNLFPANEDAKRLSSQTLLLCEFLAQKAPDFVPPQLPRKALVHGHCHHKNILNMSGEQHLLDKLGLDYEVLDSGCCGMAGSFGFEKDKHAISMACAERVLLPAVRQAAEDTLIIADGFSCREQIAQCTERRATHIAEIMQLALRQERTTSARAVHQQCG
ncbi:MAG: heterodisulfide reductase-related iron-sulfur binding cluster [Pseudomonadota bacterium]|nr:heterodisulfide reductase-related iron-sulfur binding cluster [Pseudomonadota bacterium]